MKRIRAILLVFALGFGVAACGSDIMGPHGPDGGSHGPDGGSIVATHGPDGGS